MFSRTDNASASVPIDHFRTSGGVKNPWNTARINATYACLALVGHVPSISQCKFCSPTRLHSHQLTCRCRRAMLILQVHSARNSSNDTAALIYKECRTIENCAEAVHRRPASEIIGWHDLVSFLLFQLSLSISSLFVTCSCLCIMYQHTPGCLTKCD